MSGCEDMQNGKPSYEVSKQNEVKGTSSIENSDQFSDTESVAISSSVRKPCGDGLDIFNVVSSGDESESNSRKRRLSKPSESTEILPESIEILSKPTAPLPNVDENISPDEFLLKLVDAQLGFNFEPKKASQIKDFFSQKYGC